MNQFLFLFLINILTFSITENQLNDEFVLKAALVQKLAIFIDWEENSKNDKSFRIATLGKSKFIQSIKDNINNLKVKEKVIEVKDYYQCSDEFINFLIIGNTSSNEIQNILPKIDKKRTIIITDDKNSKNDNFDILIYIKDGKLNFRINKNLTKNENFKISYHVLKFAEVIGN